MGSRYQDGGGFQDQDLTEDFVALLRDDDMTVSELAVHHGLSMRAVLHHLRNLIDDGIVEADYDDGTIVKVRLKHG